MARLLDFNQYIGGKDALVTEMFPSTSKAFSYQFETDVSSYSFSADYRTILVDAVTYDRQTGDPNFADSQVLGYFGVTDTDIPGSNIDTSSATSGIVTLTIPADRYTGSILPDSRNRVPITVVTFRWSNSTGVVDSHRYCILERWEPEVAPGDPIYDGTFIQMGVGAIRTVSDDAAANATRATVTDETGAPVAFNGVSGLTSGEGTGAQFQMIVETDGNVTVNITNRGTGYNVNDTITILDSDLGGSGAPNITLTVTAVG